MKKVILMALIAATTFGTLQAQDQKASPTAAAPKERKMPAKKLNLTEEQKQKIKTIRAANKERIKDIKRQEKQDIEAVLTPEQAAQIQKHRNENMKKKMNLTPEQAARLKDLNQNFKLKADPIKQNASMSDDQKKAALQELRMAKQKEMQSFLTPEQIEMMKRKK